MVVLMWKSRLATRSLQMPNPVFFADERETLETHTKRRKENLQHTLVKQGMMPRALGRAGRLPWEIRLHAQFLHTRPLICVKGMLFLHDCLF